MNRTTVPAPRAAFADDHATAFPTGGDDHATAATGCLGPGGRRRAGPPG
ncbi:hypothetical protein ACH427_00360 [Streptomyces sp. NPDC020379]